MKTTITLLSSVTAVIIFLTASVWNSGGSPGAYTGSPGDNANTCTQCHTGSNQQASGWITSNIPPEGYVPGQIYTVTATGTHTGVSRFGFEVTAENAAAAKQGAFIITNATETKLVNAGKAVSHTFAGTTPSGSSKSWSFDWTAPASGSGIITFFGAFNAANGNGGTSGDVIYLSTLSAGEASTSIREDAARKLARVYPNPFVNYLDISFEEKNPAVREIRMYSGNGTMVHSDVLTGSVNGTYRIPAESLAGGIYQLSIILQSGQRTDYKVIKF